MSQLGMNAARPVDDAVDHGFLVVNIDQDLFKEGPHEPFRMCMSGCGQYEFK